MRLYMVRHTAVEVPRAICYGRTDVPLKESCTEEFEAVRAKVARHNYGNVYMSPLTRCRRLAVACDFAHARIDDRLQEMDFGEWEWVYLYDMLEVPAVREWFEDPINRRAPKGESIGDMRARLEHFLEEKRKNGEDELLLFTHGGIILCAEMMRGLQIGPDPYAHLRPYGSLTVFDF